MGAVHRGRAGRGRIAIRLNFPPMTIKQRIIERIEALPDTPETEVLLEAFEQKLIELFPEIDFPPRPD
jgi:uncharacterized protein YlzI (FlbEa/FlbD family)